MRIRLYRAFLRYGGSLVLHTASSGRVEGLDTLFLVIDDGKQEAHGEVRINVAYLNGYAPEDVVAAAEATLAGIDWREAPETILTVLHGTAGPIAPVRMLVDVALHDLIAMRRGLPLAKLLEPTADIPVACATNQTLFVSSDAEFLANAEAYVRRGFRDLKVRIAAGAIDEDVARLRLLRDRFGGDVTLAADANGRWLLESARANLDALAPFGLTYVEQPVAPGDWTALARLAGQSPIPLMLDESLASPADVDALVETGSGLMAHLKLVKLGGIAPTFAAARTLSAAGMPFMIGQMNEGHVATAAVLHLAAATRPAFAELYGADGLADDPSSGPLYREGRVINGDGAGLATCFDASKARLVKEIHCND